MKNKGRTSGITLIALIITIIVMMILVGVTVTVALNGGLFDTTKRAAIQQEIATMQDMISAQEAKILADKAQTNQTLSVSTQEILSSYGVTSPEIISMATEPAPEYVTNELIPPTGTCYKLDPSILGVDISRGQGTVEEGIVSDVFVIDSNKKVHYIREATLEVSTPPLGEQASDALLDYILGEVDNSGVRPGKDFFELIGYSEENMPDSQSNFVFAEVPEELGALIGGPMNLLSETDTEIEAELFFSQTLNNERTVYKFKMIASFDYTTETMSMLTSPEYGVQCVLSLDENSRYGEVVKYGGMTCIVIYDDDEHGLQLAAAEEIASSYTLGSGNSIEDVVDLNENGTPDNFEIALNRYNNAVQILNDVCYIAVDKSAVVKKDEKYLIRSIGTNSTIDNFGGDIYESFVVSDETIPGYGDSEWFENGLNLTKSADGTSYTIGNTETSFVIKASNENSSTDMERMLAFSALLGTPNLPFPTDYLAVRSIEADRNEDGTISQIDFNVGNTFLFRVKNDSTTYVSSDIYGSPCPVFCIDENLFEQFEDYVVLNEGYGNGSTESPWDLDKYLDTLSLESDGNIEYNKYYTGVLGGEFGQVGISNLKVIFFENGISHIHISSDTGGYNGALSFLSYGRYVDEDTKRIVCETSMLASNNSGVPVNITLSVQNDVITNFTYSDTSCRSNAPITAQEFDYTKKDSTNSLYLNVPYIAESGETIILWETNVASKNPTLSSTVAGLGYAIGSGIMVYDYDESYTITGENTLTRSINYTRDPNFDWNNVEISE